MALASSALAALPLFALWLQHFQTRPEERILLQKSGRPITSPKGAARVLIGQR